MDFVETDGETIDDAISNALKTLGVERDNVTVRGAQGYLWLRRPKGADSRHPQKTCGCPGGER